MVSDMGLAVPHGRLKNVESPIIAFCRSFLGIDWGARDGLATHYVFLILTPEKEEGVQVQILAAIARCMLKPDIQSRIMASEDSEEIFRILSQALSTQINEKSE